MNHVYHLAISPDLLPAFLAVADVKTTTKAARVLHVSQPTVTSHIGQLESSLSASLFKRSPKGMELTEEGRALYPYAKSVIATLHDATLEISKSDTLAGTVSIAASTTIASYILPQVIRQFREIHPDIHIQLASLNTAETIDSVADGHYRIGLMEGFSDTPHVHLKTLCEDDLILVGSPHDVVELRSPKDLQKLNFIWREQGSGTRDIIEDALAHHGINIDTLNRPLELGSTEAIKQAASQGLGVAFMSKWAVQGDLLRGYLKHIHVPKLTITRPLYWCLPRGQMDKLHTLFFNFTNETLKQLLESPKDSWAI
jgi:DNA-binding transcriptional LysR family regulator